MTISLCPDPIYRNQDEVIIRRQTIDDYQSTIATLKAELKGKTDLLAKEQQYSEYLQKRLEVFAAKIADATLGRERWRKAAKRNWRVCDIEHHIIRLADVAERFATLAEESAFAAADCCHGADRVGCKAGEAGQCLPVDVTE